MHGDFLHATARQRERVQEAGRVGVVHAGQQGKVVAGLQQAEVLDPGRGQKIVS